MASKWNRLPLRTILLAVNLLVLLLPLAGIFFLRIYESVLVRQTEAELISQGAFVSAAYKTALLSELSLNNVDVSTYGSPMSPIWASQLNDNAKWQPRPAKLDLAVDTILPRPPDATQTEQIPDKFAQHAGEAITPLMREAQVITLAGIRVVDQQGVIIASTGSELGLSLTNRDGLRRALRGEHVSLMRSRISDESAPPLSSISRDTKVRVFVSMPIIEKRQVLGAVALSRTPRSLGQALYENRWLFIYGGTVLLVVVFLISLFLSLTIRTPILALIRQTEHARHGKTGTVAPLTHPVTREVAQLSGAVSELSHTLEQRADYIRVFASHVSHAFKTPLTAIQGAVELLDEHLDDMSIEERKHFLQNLGEDTARLARLVNRLLELARADIPPPSGEEKADVKQVVTTLASQYRTEDVSVVIHEIDQPLTVSMNEDVLASILNNLLDNACQNCQAPVTIELYLKRDKDNAMIVVQDNGPGIVPELTERIFEPFFTQTPQPGGTGLGLAVVRALVTAHHGKIRLLPKSEGATFELSLPY
ncbi:MAG: ATP-binding protein [Pseudomonadota bacterium]